MLLILSGYVFQQPRVPPSRCLPLGQAQPNSRFTQGDSSPVFWSQGGGFSLRVGVALGESSPVISGFLMSPSLVRWFFRLALLCHGTSARFSLLDPNLGSIVESHMYVSKVTSSGDSGGLAGWSNPRVPLCLVGSDLGSLTSDLIGAGISYPIQPSLIQVGFLIKSCLLYQTRPLCGFL